MTATTVASPYRGLASFGDSDADALVFFGRERETEIVSASLLASRLTVLYGPSGAGKSSLLRAGVARRVRADDVAVVLFSSWTAHPARALADAIGEAVRPLVAASTLEPPADASLVEVAEHWATALDGDLCLVLDHVEELFVYHDDAAEAFLDELARVLRATHVRANTLLAIREDELAQLGALRARVPNVFANARRLERLDRDAARAAIVGPIDWWNREVAPAEGMEIEEALVDDVLRETAADESHIEAPYLQLVLERVWEEERARGSHVLRASTLAELGGAGAVVRDHLERALDALEPAQQDAAARMFAHLVTPSGTKISHRASDLAAFAQVDDETSRDLLESLGRDRVVRRLDEPAGARRYEIFHDVLADAIVDWGARRQLVAERERARLRQRRLVTIAAVAVAAMLVMAAIAIYALVQRSDARTQAGRADASALAAAALAQSTNDPETALRLARDAAATDRTRGIEDALRTALQASRARAILRGGARPVLGVWTGGRRSVTLDDHGVLRSYPGGRATKLAGRVRAAASTANSLALASRFLVQVRPEAGRAAPFAFRVPSPVRALAIDGAGDRVAVATLDRRLVVRGADGPATTVRAPVVQTAVALDGDGALAAGASGAVATVWRGAKRVVEIATGSDIADLALSPDGTLLATAGADGGARVWSLPGGSLKTIAITPDQLTRIAFSDDGGAFAVGAATGVTRVYDSSSGRPISVLARHADAVTAVAFAPDDRRVVTGSRDGGARVWDPGIAPDLRPIATPPGCCTAFATAGGGWIAGTGAVTAVAPPYTGTRTGEVLRGSAPVLSLRGAVTALAARGDELAAASGRAVVVRGGARFTEKAPVDGLALSPDGTLVATAGTDRVARIRDARTGRLRIELRGHRDAVTSVAFSPDGTRVATASADHDVRVWDARTGRQLLLVHAHFGRVASVAYSPDGRWLVTAGPKTVGLFHADTGVSVALLRGPTKPLVGAGFVGDTTIDAAAKDGVVRSYSCEICGGLDALAALADARIRATGGPLTPAAERAFLVR
ncbi:MAG TPA: WD40 repeat domain-containing protein [Gaiellaceae bacterium]